MVKGATQHGRDFAACVERTRIKSELYSSPRGEEKAALRLAAAARHVRAAMAAFRPRHPVKGVVLDMDDTLTAAGAIDFAAMRRRCGVPGRRAGDDDTD